MLWTDYLKESLWWRYMVLLCRPARLRRYLTRKKIGRYPPQQRVDRHRVRVAAVQVKVKMVNDPLEYVDQMFSLTREAVHGGAQMIVFPEYNFVQLLGLWPIASKKRGATDLRSVFPISGADIMLKDIFACLSPISQAVYFVTFSELARRFTTYIMAGSLITTDPEGKVVNASHLFGPDGTLIGRQVKTHLAPVENDWGLSAGNDLHFYTTPLGNLALPSCTETSCFELFRQLAWHGAEIALFPTAYHWDYTDWKALRGIWGRVQESAVYGIKSVPVGEGPLNLRFAGRSAIYAPLALTPKGDGILAQAASFDEEEIVLANLDLEALHAYREQHQAGDINRELYEKYMPGAYKQIPTPA